MDEDLVPRRTCSRILYNTTGLHNQTGPFFGFLTILVRERPRMHTLKEISKDGIAN